MASANRVSAGPRDWAPAQPWPWAAAGLALAGAAAAWGRVTEADDGRVVALALGLVCAGVAVALRLRTGRPGWLNAAAPGPRRALLLSLAGLFGLGAGALTAIVVLSLLEKVPFRPAGSIVAWVLFAPLSLAAARAALRRAGTADVGAPGEAAAVLLTAALTVVVGSFALDTGEADDWDTLRFFLRVAAVATAAGAGLAIVSPRARRLAASLLIVAHFGGISTASLAAAPSPWVMNQLWLRVYRPYLEFMYLNNAYHFYAPEPGPARYLWFRVVYTAPDGREHGMWYEVPKMNAKGHPQHPVALEYQRYLALTEGTAASEPAPATTVTDADGQLKPARFYERRIRNMPGPIMVGEKAPALAVPLHPYVPHLQQYQEPAPATRLLLKSYARHVIHKFARHPDHPDWVVKGVKVYRADHMMVPVHMFARGMDPRDPETYRPFYLGMYDVDGKLLDPDDPFLYWLLPVARFPSGNDPNPPVKNYARLHAGDVEWVCPVGPDGKAEIGTWVNPRDPAGPVR